MTSCSDFIQEQLSQLTNVPTAMSCLHHALDSNRLSRVHTINRLTEQLFMLDLSIVSLPVARRDYTSLFGGQIRLMASNAANGKLPAVKSLASPQQKQSPAKRLLFSTFVTWFDYFYRYLP